MTDCIYLDNGATTRPDPAVMRAMLDRQATLFANPSSRHRPGLDAAKGLASARARLAELVGATPDDIVLTGGGTEAAGLAVLGSAGPRPGRIAISAVEHPCIGRAAAWLGEYRGWQTDVIPVDADGRVTPKALAGAIGPDTRIVAVMMAQNEVGSVNDIGALARVVRATAPRARFVVDAVQAFARVPIDVQALDIDCLFAASHKIHGPRGIGLLCTRVSLRPVFAGGGQERGRRGGTQAAPLAMAFADAATLQFEQREHLAQMRDALWSAIQSRLPDVVLTGPAPGPHRLPHNLHICVPGVPGEPLFNALADRGVYVSTGSACSAGRFSGTLSALGRRADEGAFLRLTPGRFTTGDEVQRAAEHLAAAVAALTP